jgi:hypothetical protein
MISSATREVAKSHLLPTMMTIRIGSDGWGKSDAASSPGIVFSYDDPRAQVEEDLIRYHSMCSNLYVNVTRTHHSTGCVRTKCTRVPASECLAAISAARPKSWWYLYSYITGELTCACFLV